MPENPSRFNIGDFFRGWKRLSREAWMEITKSAYGIGLPEIIGLPPVETGALNSPSSVIYDFIEEIGIKAGWRKLVREIFGERVPRNINSPEEAKIFIGRELSNALVIAAQTLANYSKIIAAEMFPIIEIVPCKPKAVGGTNIYQLQDAWAEYTEVLNYLGFRLTNKVIRLALLAESFPTETFSNDYGESFNNIDVTEIGHNIRRSSEEFGVPRELADILRRGYRDTPNIRRENNPGPFGSRGERLFSQVATGSRIDFPNVWKNSSFGPSWSFTVRLYNPFPFDRVTTNYFISGPLSAILALGLPITKDGTTYSWPFLLKCRIPGYLDATPSFIQSMTVIKGGDQQQVGFNQRLGIVDVRIDLGCLYSTLLATTGEIKNPDRPTLKKYIEVLGEEKSPFLMRPKDFPQQLQRSASQLGKVVRETEMIVRFGKNMLGNIYDNIKSKFIDRP